MNEEQRNIIETSLVDRIEEWLEQEHIEWLLKATRASRPEKNQLTTLLIIEFLEAYAMPPAIKVLMEQVIAAIKRTQVISDDVIKQLEAYPNYDLYNLAEIQRFSTEVINLPDALSSPLMSFREICLGMTPLIERDWENPPYSRISGLPLRLESMGPITKDEINQCIRQLVISKIDAFLGETIDLADPEALYTLAVQHVEKQEYNTAYLLLTKAITVNDDNDDDDGDVELKEKSYYLRIVVSQKLPVSFLNLVSDFKKLFEYDQNGFYRVEFINLCMENSSEYAIQQALITIQELGRLQPELDLEQQLVVCYHKLGQHENALMVCWALIINKNIDGQFTNLRELNELYLKILEAYGLKAAVSILDTSNDIDPEGKLHIYRQLIILFPQKILDWLPQIKTSTVKSSRDVNEYLLGLTLMNSMKGKTLTKQQALTILTHFSEAEKWGLNVQPNLTLLYVHAGFDPKCLIDLAAEYVSGKRLDKSIECARNWLALAATKFKLLEANFRLAKLHHEGIDGNKNLLEAARWYLRITKCWSQVSSLCVDEYNAAINLCVENMISSAHRLKMQGHAVAAYRHLQAAYLLQPKELIQELLQVLQTQLSNKLLVDTDKLPEQIVEAAKSQYVTSLQKSGLNISFNKGKLNTVIDSVKDFTRVQLPKKMLACDVSTILNSTAALLIRHNIFYKKNTSLPHMSINTDINISREVQNEIENIICNNALTKASI